MREIYDYIVKKYGFNNYNEMFDYIRIKQNRNADSHFNEQIENFDSAQANPLEKFIDRNDYLRGALSSNEINLLTYTFKRYAARLQAKTK